MASYWEYWRLARGTRQDRLAIERARHPAREAIDEAVEAGNPSVVQILVALAEAAPSDEDAGLVGAGPIEDLISTHGQRLACRDGSQLLDELDAAARRSPRFRRALQSAWMGDEVPTSVRERLGRFFKTPGA